MRLTASLLAVLLIAACAKEPEIPEIPPEVKREMPELYTAMFEGVGQMKGMTGELAISVDAKGATAALSGAGSLRSLNVIDTLGTLQASRIRVAPDGTKPGPVSILIHQRRVLVLAQHDRKVQRYNFDGTKDGGTFALRDVVRLLGVTRDSLDVLLGEKMANGGVRYAGIGRVGPRGGKVRILLPASALHMGELIAPSDSAAALLFPLAAVDGSIVVVMDMRDGMLRSYSPQSATPKSFGPMGGSATTWSSAAKVVGISFDSSHRLWRFTADENRMIADVFAEGEQLGLAVKPCHRMQGAVMRGEFAAILCSDPGLPDIEALPTVFNISG